MNSSANRLGSPLEKLKRAFGVLAVTSLVLGAARHYLPPLATVVAQGTAGSEAKAAKKDASDWTLYRGNVQADGIAPGSLPDGLDVLWKYTVDGGSFQASAVIADGTVFVGDVDGTFFALGLDEGQERWRLKTESGFSAAAAVSGGLLYVGDTSGKFYCLDPKTGEQKWTFESQAEINASPNFYKDTVLFGSQDSTLYCLKAATGDVVWKYAIEDQIRCMPTIVENRAFLAGCDAKLHIIDLDKGESVGEVEIDGPTGSTPAVRGNLVAFGTEGGSVFGIDWQGAKVQWKYKDPKKSLPYRSAAAMTDGLAILGSRDKNVRALDLKSGKEVWRFATRGNVESSPVVVGDRVFVGSGDGRVYGLNLTDGKKVWEYEAGGSFIASPAVAASRMVIASEEGHVFCFGAK